MARPLAGVARRPLEAAVWPDWLAALALALIALPIALHNLGAQSLWLDEGTTQAYVTGHQVGALLLDLFRPTSAYPLYHLILKATTRLLGDSEWALRLPSATAGSLAVPGLYLLGSELRSRATGLAAAALLLLAPWALRQAQDAKAYSLALLTTIALGLLFARALRANTRWAWLWCAMAAVVAPFVHRLLLLSLLGCAACWALYQPRPRRTLALSAITLIAAFLLGTVAAGLRYQHAGGQFAGVGPFQALSLTFAQFALAQFAHDVPALWLAPFGLLMIVGLGHCLYDFRRQWPARRAGGERDAAIRHGRGATVLLLVGGLPLALFLLLLTIQPLYEPRYLVAVYPFWLLLLGWGLLPALRPRRHSGMQRMTMGAIAAGAVLLIGSLVVEQRALVQPGKGIFSGAPVKEEYREAVRYLAEHVHPDDLVIVHPDTIEPLYAYYSRRVAAFPMPHPKTYPQLGRAQGFEARELDMAIRSDLQHYPRAWLLIAPDHAQLADPPAKRDELGLVGLAFQYGEKNRRIQCGPPPYAGFVGVRVYCNNMPEIVGKVPQPKVGLQVTFGQQLRLQGYTVTPFPGGPKPGGTLPVTLFWEPLANLAGTDYLVFLHLTLPGDPKPLTQTDGRPMEGGQPTSRWTKPHVLLHDGRAIPLPADLPPGRYVIRMGVYRASDGARLHAETQAPVLDDAVVLGEVQIATP